ncbi:dUTP diphosphatase [Anaerobacillus sp. CMMVII]|nr:dUTP diphosphatase [Anaerobacillus sp. CMMVII]
MSLANDFKINPENFIVTCDYTKGTLTETLTEVFAYVSSLHVLFDVNIPATITGEDLHSTLHEAFSCYVGLGEKFLGLTWAQIEKAYLEKNEVNHIRQDNSY